MKWLSDSETWAAVLKHPVVLAGGAVVALLGLTAGILIVIEAARGDAADPPEVLVTPVTTTTPGNASKTAEATGVRGRTTSVTTVRQAPGLSSAVRGTLPRNVEVVVDGRSGESGWLRIIFPPNSETHGWVDAEDLDLTGDPASLVIATAEPPVIVEVPTSIPRITPEPSELAGETTTPESTATPPEAGLPDLVVGSTPTLSGGLLFITVVNQGQGDAAGDLVVAVFNADGTALLAGATLPGFTLEGGRSIDIGTGYAVTQNQTLLLIVDPNGTIEETDNTNNRISVAIAVGNPPPPPPIETPIPDVPVP